MHWRCREKGGFKTLQVSKEKNSSSVFVGKPTRTNTMTAAECIQCRGRRIGPCCVRVHTRRWQRRSLLAGLVWMRTWPGSCPGLIQQEIIASASSIVLKPCTSLLGCAGGARSKVHDAATLPSLASGRSCGVRCQTPMPSSSRTCCSCQRCSI